MATINLGRVGLVQKGTWQAGTTYQMLDVVKFNGTVFVCKVASTTAATTDTTKWDAWVSDGINGTNGIDGVAGGTETRIFNFVGDVVPTAGIAKFYPPRNITISNLYAVLGSISPVITTALLKKNGSTIATVNIPANADKSTNQAVSLAVTATDYLTVDVMTTGGKNLNLTMVYS